MGALRQFHPVIGANKAEAIGLQIEASILDKVFKAGDRLPSERELQDAFQTSRGSVREALRALRQKGLLDAKKGAKGGYYVKERHINEAIDLLAVMIKHQEIPLAKLLEFQYAMDQAVLSVAVTNAAPRHIERLAGLADELVALCRDPESDYKKISATDRKLNLLMVEMTDNPFFEWIMRSVQLAFRAYEFVVYKTPAVRMEIALNWKSVAAALKTRDFQKAMRLYGHWYVLLEQCLVEQFGDAAFQNGSADFNACEKEYQ